MVALATAVHMCSAEAGVTSACCPGAAHAADTVHGQSPRARKLVSYQSRAVSLSKLVTTAADLSIVVLSNCNTSSSLQQDGCECAICEFMLKQECVRAILRRESFASSLWGLIDMTLKLVSRFARQVGDCCHVEAVHDPTTHQYCCNQNYDRQCSPHGAFCSLLPDARQYPRFRFLILLCLVRHELVCLRSTFTKLIMKELEILCIVGRSAAQVLGRLHSNRCQFRGSLNHTSTA
jgi:hypothetical protein